MIHEAPARRSRSIAVTVLGLGTLLVGGGYLALGCLLVSGGDPWGPGVSLYYFGPAFVIVVGVASLALGLLGLLAGSVVLLRKRWGRVPAFVLAVVAALAGLIWGGGDGRNASDVALGAAQLLYGILAVAVLIWKAGDFYPTPP